MSKVITESLAGGVQHAFALSNQFVDVCPEEVWGKTFGKWPVWQQLFHAYAAVDFFLRSADASPETSIFPDGVGDLKTTMDDAPAKLIIKDYFAQAQKRVNDYIATLDDAKLAQKHEGLSARFGRDVTHAANVALIASHTMYHLGCCDAALRESGLPGVF